MLPLVGRIVRDLTELANDLRQWPSYYLLIEGDSESKGDPEENKKLRARRAEAVRRYLIDMEGIEEFRLKAVAAEESGHGKEVRLQALRQP